MKFQDIILEPNNLKSYKSREVITLECDNCQEEFGRTKNIIQAKIKLNQKYACCSLYCIRILTYKRQTVTCKECNKKFIKKFKEYKKSENHFCSKSCAATYNNKNKIHGTKRSKLEIWLEKRLTDLYPNLDFHFNRKDAIGSELDIYIPTLKLAFELNGIFHYEPIFGQDKLNQIQKNDKNKFQKCQENNISLCIIDTSWIKYHKEKNCEKVLSIITNIIEST